jgi:hypothetical protein
MTTIAANLEMMVCDSNVTDGEQRWSEDKVFEHKGALYATAGDAIEGEMFEQWVLSDKRKKRPKLTEEFVGLKLTKNGLFWYDQHLSPKRESAPYTIGSGAAVARAALMVYGEMQFDPNEALVKSVEIACKIDGGSALPVRIHRLKR